MTKPEPIKLEASGEDRDAIADNYPHYLVRLHYGARLPPLIYFAINVGASGLDHGAKLSKDDIAAEIQRICDLYLFTALNNEKMSAVAAIPKGKRLRGLKSRGKGNRSRAPDFEFIAGCARLLQRMKGHNARIGWGHWNDYKGKRCKSEVQLFSEAIFAICDPDRKTLPPASYYPQVKRRLGLTMAK